MSIPPFPSQDLAKLVLGYLAEEQLMTAYDEFLQASPYLDALRNEYDRIFMTSLKSILAEYRAVKIYVDTCKPFALRKKIFQCTSLLEVVKFLIANVDIKKLQLQEAEEKSSLEKPSITTTPKSNTLCELCHSLSLQGCVCKNRTDVQKPEVYASYVETSSLQTSVETTPLADLPGNHVTIRKKHGKVQEKDVVPLHSNVSSLQNSDSNARQSLSTNISPEEYLARCENSPVAKSTDSTMTLNSTVKLIDPLKSNQNIEEFNNVLKSVVNRNKTLSTSSECSSNQRISNAGTFQDFASGVTGGDRHSATYNVPDSSTSENSNVRAPLRKDVYNDNIKGPPQCQLMLQVSQVNDVIDIQTCKKAKLPKLLPKTSENQIKIISDIKVDNKFSEKINSSKKKPLVPINATSTPLMQMQTIMINGTPAYKHSSNTHTYTKDEIMNMPTLIVVPASGPSQVPTSVLCNPTTTPNTNVTSEVNNSPQILGPLVIDVPKNTAISNNPNMEALPDLGAQKPMIGDLVRTVDVKNSNGTTASVPKDNVISMESNTPQVLPPMRKSSSTPRRTSHVRVLDFTTPRRILHETVNEQVPSQSSDPQVDIVVSGSEDTANAPPSEPETIDVKSNVVVLTEEGNNDTGSTKENEAAHKKKPAKKIEWDADLRALVANQKPINIPHRKPKQKASKKKKSSDKTHTSKDSETKKKSRSKQSPRVKKSTSRTVDELDDEPPPDTGKTCDVPCKPTVKIICGSKVTGLQENKAESSNKNKSLEKTEEYVETPETERLSLQNVIGAKLNISDFLETPYKQALYDIQMETPRFLGPDLPDEPLSDIKIMNIPTPRFLNTPNLAQATPSYASRPTDYSSGGSYYKPDDQDYMPIPDLTTCPVTSSKEDLNVEKSTEKDSDEKKSRPVRKCAKNVSYYKSSGAVKKDAEDNIDAISSCSETIGAINSFEFRSKNETTRLKTPRAKAQSTSRTDSRTKTSTSKKKKSQKDSVVKDKPKSFMKIKPKYTPKKGTPAKNGKKMVQSPHSRGYPSVPQRKRTTSKERLVNVTSIIAPAATKSRRKSSTPRKLHCTKIFNSQVYSDDIPDNISNTTPNVNRGETSRNTLNSETEQIALRWSDEGSEDGKPKGVPTKPIPKETECITQIQEFIDSTGVNNSSRINATQRDLMKRGFDLETAKIIERDLMDDTPVRTEATKSRTLPISAGIVENKKDDSPLDKTAESSSNELQIVQDESDDEIELSVHECDEESNNYFVFKHDYTKEVSQQPPIKIKDNFTMEVCIDDVTVRLIAPPFKFVLDQDPLTVDEIDYSYRETEQAVKSISGMDRLYTPLKDSFKLQCYEIFDSTLTSIDTPLKSPVRNTSDATVTALVLKGEKTEPKDSTEVKKRKRARSSSNDSANSSKRTKPDADLLLKAANIQNIDIETVLTKLHGH